jgi:hypothetical protein
VVVTISLNPTIQLDDILLTLDPKPVKRNKPKDDAASNAPASQGTTTTTTSIREGIKMVAMGLETLFERLTVSINKFILKLEVPSTLPNSLDSQQHILLVFANKVNYGPTYCQPPAGSEGVLARRVSLQGICSALQPAGSSVSDILVGSSDGAGVDCTIEVRLWSSLAKVQPTVTIELSQTVEVRLAPQQAASLLDTLSAVTQVEVESTEEGEADTKQSRNLLEDLILPDCSKLAAEACEEGDEVFYDASSLIDSIHSLLAEVDQDNVQTMASSYHEQQHPRYEPWELYVSSPGLVFLFVYGQGAFLPRIVLEVDDLQVFMQSLYMTVAASRLEVAEHLPFPRSDTDSYGKEYKLPSGQMLERLSKVPGKLPRSLVDRATPKCAGDYPLPFRPSSFASTLQQLSQLNEEIFFSAADCLDTTVHSTDINDTGARGRVQIQPILVCEGIEKALVVTAAAVESDKRILECATGSISVFVTMPMLQRMLMAQEEYSQACCATSYKSASQSKANAASVQRSIHAHILHACIVIEVPSGEAPDYIALDLHASDADNLLKVAQNSGRLRHIRHAVTLLREDCPNPMFRCVFDAESASTAGAQFEVAMSTATVALLRTNDAVDTLIRVNRKVLSNCVGFKCAWKPPSSTPDLFNEDLWRDYNELPRIDIEHLRKQCIQNSCLHIEYDGHMQAELSKELITACCTVADAVLQLSAQKAQDLTVGMPITIDICADVDCVLHGDATFQLKASLELFCAQNVDGFSGNGLLLLRCAGTSLHVYENGAGVCLLHQRHIASPEMKVVFLSKPKADTKPFRRDNAIVVPVQSVMKIKCAELAIHAGSDFSFGWLRSFGAFFVSTANESASTLHDHSMLLNLKDIVVAQSPRDKMPFLVMLLREGAVLVSKEKSISLSGVEIRVLKDSADLPELLNPSHLAGYLVLTEKEVNIKVFNRRYTCTNRLMKLLLCPDALLLVRQALRSEDSRVGGPISKDAIEERLCDNNSSLLAQLKENAFSSNIEEAQESAFFTGGYYSDEGSSPSDAEEEAGRWLSSYNSLEYVITPSGQLSTNLQNADILLDKLNICLELKGSDGISLVRCNLTKLTVARATLPSASTMVSLVDIDAYSLSETLEPYSIIGYYNKNSREEGMAIIDVAIEDVHTDPSNTSSPLEHRVLMKVLPFHLRLFPELVQLLERYKENWEKGVFQNSAQQQSPFVQRFEILPTTMCLAWNNVQRQGQRGGPSLQNLRNGALEEVLNCIAIDNVKLNLIGQRLLGLPGDQVGRKLLVSWLKDVKQNHLGPVAAAVTGMNKLKKKLEPVRSAARSADPVIRSTVSLMLAMLDSGGGS